MGVQIKDIIWEIYIPVLLPWIPCIYFLNRKFNSPDFNAPVKTRISAIFFCILTAGGMLFMLNRYIKESNDILIELPDVTKLDSVKTGKYFELKEYSVNPFGGHHIHYTKSARRTSNRLNMNVYIALPLLKNKKALITDFPIYWYGIKFSMWTNGGSATYMRALEQEFLKECQQKIKAMTFDNEEYFELLSKSADKKQYENAINSIPIPRLSHKYVILTPSFDSFNHKAVIALYWFFSIFIVGTILFIAALMDAPVKKKTDQAIISDKGS